MSEKQPLLSGPPYPGNPQGQPQYPGTQGQPPYPYPSAQGQQPYPPAQGQQPYPPAQGQQPYPPAQGQQPYSPPSGQSPYPAAGGATPGYQSGYPAATSGNHVDTPTWQGEVPDDDPDENPNVQPPSATAPPLEKMDQFSGYENMEGTPLQPPPSYNEALHSQPPQSQDMATRVPVVSEEQARNALLDHVSQNCCFGSKPANELIFTNILPSSAFHYSLESYTEKRSTKWAYEPYHGQVIDGSFNGVAPSPWDIEARPPALFQSHTVNMEVPHTASVKPCHDCIGLGRKRCYNCHGRGRTRCHSCHGHGHSTHYINGHHERRHCHFCHGHGRKRCFVCNGHGHTACHTCNARGQLKCFIRLTIEWIVHHDDHVVERTSLPDELIRTVSGETVFKQELPRVWPINHFPDVNINEASKNLVQRHLTGFQAERIIMQRHKVRVIPVANIHCHWNNNSFSYFVYGFEHKVHAPDYPQQCCCGCTLL
ncbi:protein SSUH2 homolog [Saccoglossus kowalevskii]|uniref:Protein SSUH2 homolog n=1 Tax=Saccoglossus kowalevskii TaxID=10224 RepID=A0ABM0GYN9_SACKO|nr:PREDICTED: protein SSUH2 homolog [Saccoglossus kowalevskii]